MKNLLLLNIIILFTCFASFAQQEKIVHAKGQSDVYRYNRSNVFANIEALNRARINAVSEAAVDITSRTHFVVRENEVITRPRRSIFDFSSSYKQDILTQGKYSVEIISVRYDTIQVSSRRFKVVCDGKFKVISHPPDGELPDGFGDPATLPDARKDKRLDPFQFNNMIGIADLTYDVFNSYHLSVGNFLFGFKSKTFAMGFSLFSWSAFNGVNYSISNYGNMDLCLQDHASYSCITSDIYEHTGDFSGSFNMFSLLNPWFQVNLIKIPGFREKDAFDLRNFYLSAYAQIYPMEFISYKPEFSHYELSYSFYTLGQQKKEVSPGTSTFFWSFFNSCEVGLKLHNSLFFINAGYFSVLPNQQIIIFR